jgi:hypothetical protein
VSEGGPFVVAFELCNSELPDISADNPGDAEQGMAYEENRHGDDRLQVLSCLEVFSTKKRDQLIYKFHLVV